MRCNNHRRSALSCSFRSAALGAPHKGQGKRSVPLCLFPIGANQGRFAYILLQLSALGALRNGQRYGEVGQEYFMDLGIKASATGMEIRRYKSLSVLLAPGELPLDCQSLELTQERMSKMNFHQIADSGMAITCSPLSRRIARKLSMFRTSKMLYLGVCVFLSGMAAAMGSGSGGGGGGSAENNRLKLEVGGSAFKVYNQGVDLMRARKYAEAQIKFEEAIRDNPNFAEAHNNLGFTLRQQGSQNYSKALEHYNRAIQLKPSMAETYEYRGVLLAKMGRKANAEKDLDTLKKLNPKLAGELEEFLKTGKEEDEYDATSPKQKS